MKIPVFVSCPTDLSPQQENARDEIAGLLEDLALEPRALGRSDYPADLPLREVFVLAKHCSGGVILGFEQFRTDDGFWKKGTTKESVQKGQLKFPTPWNHLESGILYSMGKPLLVFKEDGISGGVFDPGVTDVFVHRMPTSASDDGLKEVFLKWRSKVEALYYDTSPAI